MSVAPKLSTDAEVGPPVLPLAVPLYSDDPAKITAATLLGLSRATVYRFAREGRLPVVKLGRRSVVPVARLEQMLADPGEQR